MQETAVVVAPTRKQRIQRNRDEGSKLLHADNVETASNIAAEMVVGSYVRMNGEQHPPGQYLITEIMLRMGYSESVSRQGAKRTVAWWPGDEQFRRIVNFKVAIRRMQEGHDSGSVYEVLSGMAIEQMARRLAYNPDLVKDREIIDLITKLARLFAEKKGDDAPKVVNNTIVNVFDKLPPAARQRAIEAYGGVVKQLTETV